MASNDERRSKSPSRSSGRGGPQRRGSGGRGSGGDRRDRSPGRRGDGSAADDVKRSMTTRGPVGIEGATRTPGAPPRRAPDAEPVPERPDLPEDGEVTLPRAVRRELRRSVRQAKDADEAMLALTIGSDLLEERQGEEALPYLRWAKHLAPRSAAVREGLGVAYYLAEDYAAAISELQAYRRFTSKPDQNHLVADAQRALGRGLDRIPQLIEAMQVDDVPLERRLEGLIVWASTLADEGDLGAGRAVLRRAMEEHPVSEEPTEGHVRVWYVAGDLAERAGDREDARRHFARIEEVAEGFFDVEDRLAKLR